MFVCPVGQSIAANSLAVPVRWVDCRFARRAARFLEKSEKEYPTVAAWDSKEMVAGGRANTKSQAIGPPPTVDDGQFHKGKMAVLVDNGGRFIRDCSWTCSLHIGGAKDRVT